MKEKKKYGFKLDKGREIFGYFDTLEDAMEHAKEMFNDRPASKEANFFELRDIGVIITNKN